jgi:hypothetical protein
MLEETDDLQALCSSLEKLQNMRYIWSEEVWPCSHSAFKVVNCKEAPMKMVHAQEFGRRIPFAFLEDVRERYLTKFRESVQTAPAYAHNAEFSKVPAHEGLVPLSCFVVLAGMLE